MCDKQSVYKPAFAVLLFNYRFLKDLLKKQKIRDSNSHQLNMEKRVELKLLEVERMIPEIYLGQVNMAFLKFSLLPVSLCKCMDRVLQGNEV